MPPPSIRSANGALASFPSSGVRGGEMITHLHTYSGSELLGSLQTFDMEWWPLVPREASA